MGIEIMPGEPREDFLKRAAEFYDSALSAVQQASESAMEQSSDAVDGGIVLFEQASLLAADKPQIDRDAGVLRKVHIMGPVSKHGYTYGVDAMRAVAKRFEGMPVGVDHDYKSGPLTDDHTWGNIRGPITADENGIWGDLHFVKAHVRTEQLLESIERGLRDVALSPINVVRREQGKVVTDFVPSRIDVVIGAATTKSMFEQADPPPAPDLSAKVADLETQLADLKARQARYEQYFPPRSAVEAEVEKTTQGIDLKAHWADKE